MPDNLAFSGNSYFAGFITGLFIQWTNIVPVLGAFVLGLSIRNIPEMIDLKYLPNNFSTLLQFVFSLKKPKIATDLQSTDSSVINDD